MYHNFYCTRPEGINCYLLLLWHVCEKLQTISPLNADQFESYHFPVGIYVTLSPPASRLIKHSMAITQALAEKACQYACSNNMSYVECGMAYSIVYNVSVLLSVDKQGCPKCKYPTYAGGVLFFLLWSKCLAI